MGNRAIATYPGNKILSSVRPRQRYGNGICCVGFLRGNTTGSKISDDYAGKIIVTGNRDRIRSTIQVGLKSLCSGS